MVIFTVNRSFNSTVGEHVTRKVDGSQPRKVVDTASKQALDSSGQTHQPRDGLSRGKLEGAVAASTKHATYSSTV